MFVTMLFITVAATVAVSRLRRTIDEIHGEPTTRLYAVPSPRTERTRQHGTTGGIGVGDRNMKTRVPRRSARAKDASEKAGDRESPRCHRERGGSLLSQGAKPHRENDSEPENDCQVVLRRKGSSRPVSGELETRQHPIDDHGSRPHMMTGSSGNVIQEVLKRSLSLPRLTENLCVISADSKKNSKEITDNINVKASSYSKEVLKLECIRKVPALPISYSATQSPRRSLVTGSPRKSSVNGRQRKESVDETQIRLVRRKLTLLITFIPPVGIIGLVASSYNMYHQFRRGGSYKKSISKERDTYNPVSDAVYYGTILLILLFQFYAFVPLRPKLMGSLCNCVCKSI